MEFLAIAVILLVVVAIVIAPLRAGQAEEVERRESAELADLEAAKEAKYREIRDAEMDFRTGKLDAADHKALDRQLRGEAIQLLRRIDALKGQRDEQAEAARAAVRAAEDAPARSDSPVG